MNEPVLGAILAGGLARRMGGGDKTLRRVGGRTILDHVVARFRPQCGALVVNANGDPSRFAAWGLPVVADTVPDFAGPLAGILAALDHAAEHHPGVHDVVSVAADTPFLPADLVARLLADRAEAGADLACAASGGWTHPVIGLWPVAIRDDLRRALAEGERKIDRFTARYPIAAVEWPTEPVDPFFNANAPDDLDQAEAMLARLEA
ncbi:molybdenum cofactor guanylyltransferase MobA [uncultured Enterovirga sp.]|uniref:molybdenum cofactor guanylyltransferase MobA n=1 Tax=uncultured Enterovirga sp. TaxID=2026352 RepID=UPI0035CC4553